MRNISKTLVLSSLLIWTANPLFARISLLSPWSLQDRRITPEGQVDQAASFQFGLNGVIPSGAETDGDFFHFPYQISYGVWNRLEIGAGMGLQLSDRKSRSAQFGVTDLILASRYSFFEANRDARTPGLDAEIGFSLPTASFDRGLGTGALGFIFNWGLVLPLDPARAHFGIGYRYNLENSDDVRVGSIFSYNGGVTLPIKAWTSDPNWQNFSAVAELKGFNHARNKVRGEKVGPAPDELYLAPGFLWDIHEWFSLQYSLLVGLTTDSSDFGMNLELRF